MFKNIFFLKKILQLKNLFVKLKVTNIFFFTGDNMINRVYFDDAKKIFKDFFELEFPDFTKKDLKEITDSIYKLSNYEEESVKIRPNLFFTNNINLMVKNIPNCYKLVVFKDQTGSNFKQNMKALLCFCKYDWQVYISYGNEYIEYGLIKILNSLKDKTLNQYIFKLNCLEDVKHKLQLINLHVVNGGLIMLEGLQGNKTSICFNLNDQIAFDWEEKIGQFVEASVSKVKTRSMRKLNDIKNIYFNIFCKIFQGLHGTICLIVDKDFKDKNNFFTDGTWLPEPIDLTKLFIQSKNFNEFKLSSYAEIIITMLNYDGITVMDNTGRILGYNIFIENNVDHSEKIYGGTRRRAAETLLKHKNNKIVGVYFQSQDGDNFYKDSSYYKRYKKNIAKNS